MVNFKQFALMLHVPQHYTCLGNISSETPGSYVLRPFRLFASTCYYYVVEVNFRVVSKLWK